MLSLNSLLNAYPRNFHPQGEKGQAYTKPLIVTLVEEIVWSKICLQILKSDPAASDFFTTSP
jgi:hypothetical protein